jgi:hypothetical protein
MGKGGEGEFGYVGQWFVEEVMFTLTLALLQKGEGKEE